MEPRQTCSFQLPTSQLDFLKKKAMEKSETTEIPASPNLILVQLLAQLIQIEELSGDDVSYLLTRLIEECQAKGQGNVTFVVT